jgi:outer membrane protein assembly factor BamA
MARLVKTQQNLDRLGVFSRVDVSRLSSDAGSEARTILVTVEEAKPWSLLYGLGLEYDERAERPLNPRLSLALTHANLFGRAIAGTVEARYSRRDTRVLLRLSDRSIFDSGLAGTVTAYVADEIRQSYSVKRGGGFFEASRVFAGTVKGALRYQYEIVEPDAPPEILSEIERQDQRIFINSIGASAVFDLRDDPIVPTRGVFAALEGKWAFPIASADAHFLKGFAQFTLYRPFQNGTIAAGVRAGVAKSLIACAPTANPGCLPNLDTPIVERSFAGGRTTHRSFPLDDLGVEGQTLKDGRGIGGNSLLIANVEWRVPLAGGLGLVLFTDWGNVWAGPSYVTLSEGRWGAGLGLHYLTPVGPFRLEYGFRLDRKSDEDTGALSFSIGYPF